MGWCCLLCCLKCLWKCCESWAGWGLRESPRWDGWVGGAHNINANSVHMSVLRLLLLCKMPREHWGQPLLILGPQVPESCPRKAVVWVGAGCMPPKIPLAATPASVGSLLLEEPSVCGVGLVSQELKLPATMLYEFGLGVLSILSDSLKIIHSAVFG